MRRLNVDGLVLSVVDLHELSWDGGFSLVWRLEGGLSVEGAFEGCGEGGGFEEGESLDEGRAFFCESIERN